MKTDERNTAGGPAAATGRRAVSRARWMLIAALALLAAVWVLLLLQIIISPGTITNLFGVVGVIAIGVGILAVLHNHWRGTAARTMGIPPLALVAISTSLLAVLLVAVLGGISLGFPLLLLPAGLCIYLLFLLSRRSNLLSGAASQGKRQSWASNRELAVGAVGLSAVLSFGIMLFYCIGIMRWLLADSDAPSFALAQWLNLLLLPLALIASDTYHHRRRQLYGDHGTPRAEPAARQAASADARLAVHASAEAGRRAIRKARWELMAALALLVTVVAVQLAAVGWRVLGASAAIAARKADEANLSSVDFFEITFLQFFLVVVAIVAPLAIMLHTRGMSNIFLTLWRGKPSGNAWMLVLFTLAASGILIPYLAAAASAASSATPVWISVVLIISVLMYLVTCLGLGARLLSRRKKRLDLSSSSEPHGLLERRRTIIGGAIASIALTILLFAIGVLGVLSDTGAYMITPMAMVNLLLYALPITFLLLPMALIAGDVYQLQRQRLGGGPDKRFAAVFAGAAAGAIALAFAGMLAFATANPQYLYEGPDKPHIAELELCGDEYVEVRNGGEEDLDLEGWVITQGDFFRPSASLDISAATLAHSERIRIYTQAPPADAPEYALTFGRSSPLWNDGGDIARLLDRGENQWHALSSEQCTP